MAGQHLFSRNRSGLQTLKHLFGFLDYRDQFGYIGVRETAADRRMHEIDERRPIAVHVENDDRRIVEPQLLPCNDLEGFVESSETARENHESIGHLEHSPLSVMHAFRHDEIGKAAVTHLVADQKVRYDADDLPTGFDDRISDNPHQSYRAAPLDQSHATL